MDEKKLGLKWLAMREGKFNEWGGCDYYVE
jgi:hypothetical protein